MPRAWCPRLKITGRGEWSRPKACSGATGKWPTILFGSRERYPNRKIVVWAASFHVMRNPSSIKSAGGIFSVDLYRDNVTMGHEAWKELGTQSYTLGFVAAEGTFGRYVTPPAPVREVRAVRWKSCSWPPGSRTRLSISANSIKAATGSADGLSLIPWAIGQ